MNAVSFLVLLVSLVHLVNRLVATARGFSGMPRRSWPPDTYWAGLESEAGCDPADGCIDLASFSSASALALWPRVL